MTLLFPIRFHVAALIVAGWIGMSERGTTQQPTKHDAVVDLQHRFEESVVPFLRKQCLDCHGVNDPEAKLDLSGFRSIADVTGNYRLWEIMMERMEAREMPPADSGYHPAADEVDDVIEWFRAVRHAEAQRTAGDPGIVYVRRLSNAEYNHTVRDLTGVDMRPTSTFPVDPANEFGFDNSGESLAMSPALLKKYLGAARQVAEHLVLTPEGIAFAPHSVMTSTDRDKYCVNRIVAFYQRQPTDYADYFYAAWRFGLRDQLGRLDSSLQDFANETQVSPKYLQTLWDLLNNEKIRFGPIKKVFEMWLSLPNDLREDLKARDMCEQIRDFILQFRRELIFTFPDIQVEGGHRGSQPFVLWKNRQYVKHRRKYNRDVVLPARQVDASLERTGDSDSVGSFGEILTLPKENADHDLFYDSLERFSEVFPDTFYVSERGRDYVEDQRKQDGERGRLLSAGFHSMMGYFRDDQPLYEMILDPASQREIDRLWRELDFITSAPARQYAGFLWFERTDSKFMRDPQFDFARPENKESGSREMILKLAKVYRKKAEVNGGGEIELSAIDRFFREIDSQIRWVESARITSEPKHLQAVVTFAEKAFRRPMGDSEKKELIDYYHQLRSDDGLTHEEAIQDVFVSILVSPHFSYRVDLAAVNPGIQPLNGYELVNRLSYFLWSSMPDDELMTAARTGDILRPRVLVEQVHRMLDDDRCRGLASEFGGNWLGFRRFEQHNSVDRDRFPQFNDALRSAMFEEPIRFLMDVFQSNRSILDCLYAEDTFVNPELAAHYGMPHEFRRDQWIHVEKAVAYQRGGLLPMAVFLTKNSPGLRTSPVKRGYWVVRNLLGERIPPPPPNVPELPSDESKLGDVTLREALARHRELAACAGCHKRIDSVGLVFEGFGPVGERRRADLGGRPIDDSASFPDSIGQGRGVEALKQYLKQHREGEFIDNFCRKLLSFALGRSLLLADEPLLDSMKSNIASGQDSFRDLVESIVLSPQFLNKRDRSRVASVPADRGTALPNQ